MTQAYDDDAEPLNLASLSTRCRADLGSGMGDSNWFGFGSFSRAVHSLGLPNIRVSQHFMWDDRRHPTAAPRVAVPSQWISSSTRLNLPPLLSVPLWSATYQVLSDYTKGHRFNLTECRSGREIDSTNRVSG